MRARRRVRAEPAPTRRKTEEDGAPTRRKVRRGVSERKGRCALGPKAQESVLATNAIAGNDARHEGEHAGDEDGAREAWTMRGREMSCAGTPRAQKIVRVCILCTYESVNNMRGDIESGGSQDMICRAGESEAPTAAAHGGGGYPVWKAYGTLTTLA